MRRRVLDTFAGLSALLLVSVALPPPGRDGSIGHVPAFCPFYRLTGLPCPGCGLTRAFVCMGHGRWAESLHWHPVGWLIYGICLLLWLRAGVTLARDAAFLPLSPRVAGRLSLTGAALLLLVGAARIAWLTARHQVF